MYLFSGSLHVGIQPMQACLGAFRRQESVGSGIHGNLVCGGESHFAVLVLQIFVKRINYASRGD